MPIIPSTQIVPAVCVGACLPQALALDCQTTECSPHVRFCAAGITAVSIAADRIRVGEAEVMIAGGVESMSMVPMGGSKPSFNPAVVNLDENVGIAYGMGMTAEKVAEQWKVTREEQDAFATESHRRAIAAGNLNHLGVTRAPSKSSISYGNTNRDWELFQDFYFALFDHLSGTFMGNRPGKLKIKNKVYSIDSTLVSLCMEVFDWAKYRQAKGAIKIHGELGTEY